MTDLTPEAGLALAIVPLTKEIMDAVKAKLPEGVHFGVMVLVPGKPHGHVVAMTTDRDVVAAAVAEWVLETLAPTHRSVQVTQDIRNRV